MTLKELQIGKSAVVDTVGGTGKNFFQEKSFSYVNSIFALEYNFFSCIQKVGNTFI